MSQPQVAPPPVVAPAAVAPSDNPEFIYLTVKLPVLAENPIEHFKHHAHEAGLDITKGNGLKMLREMERLYKKAVSSISSTQQSTLLAQNWAADAVTSIHKMHAINDRVKEGESRQIPWKWILIILAVVILGSIVATATGHPVPVLSPIIRSIWGVVAPFVPK